MAIYHQLLAYCSALLFLEQPIDSLPNLLFHEGCGDVFLDNFQEIEEEKKSETKKHYIFARPVICLLLLPEIFPS